MLIKQIIDFQLKGPEPSVCKCALRLVISMAKQISQSKIFEWNIIYT